MNDTGRPWHLWLIGILSLLWNSFGGYDYYMTQTGNRDYLAPMSEPYGVKVDDLIAYFDSYPVWMDVLWALGVWGSVAGAVLLLMRSGFAYYAFAVSLIGIVGTFAWSFANPLPGATDNAVAYGLTATVAILVLLQMFYARKMAAKGVLR